MIWQSLIENSLLFHIFLCAGNDKRLTIIIKCGNYHLRGFNWSLEKLGNIMSARIFLEPIRSMPTFKKRFEIVERKGIGHPDTICDLVMNQVSIELSKMYLKETGAIQHHNMDKSLLVAGQSENKFGGGKITKPMKLVIGDRATFEVKGQKLPVGDVTISTAKKWFDNNLRFVKEEHVEYQLEVGTSSHELRSIFENPKSFVANDTSALVGYAPFTKTESSVLETEEYINSQNFKKEFPESGEDVKVMGFRKDNTYTKNKGIEGLYLTVLGTTADNADSGEVGRGNMANRVISLTRPAGSEATAGKNPVSHIGKIYNALSFKIANEIHAKVSGLDEVCVWMYNVIGRPVNDPKAVIVQPTITGQLQDAEKNKINEIVENNLQNIHEFCNELISGKHPIA